jgi:hypothetical protein
MREVALLANSMFTLHDPFNEAFAQPEPTALVPQVVDMPNRARFNAAVERWQQDTIFDSLPDEMKDHDSFREIVEVGNSVVPLIAAHLRRSPSFLFLALEDIFEEDPVPEEAYGNLQATVSAWLQWLQR